MHSSGLGAPVQEMDDGAMRRSWETGSVSMLVSREWWREGCVWWFFCLKPVVLLFCVWLYGKAGAVVAIANVAPRNSENSILIRLFLVLLLYEFGAFG